jgi:hypothetical protein
VPPGDVPGDLDRRLRLPGRPGGGVAVAAAAEHEHLVDEVVFVLFDDRAHAAYAGALDRLRSG